LAPKKWEHPIASNPDHPVAGLPTLAWLKAFEAAARTSSFAAAAAELNLTSGAISYQIRALEAHLGFALFQRLPRGVKLTDLGVAYLPAVRKAFEELADSTVSLFGGMQRTKITVHAPASLTALWLASQVPAFLAVNPGIEVRMTSLVWDHSSPDETTDLEIRYGTGEWLGYRCQLLINQPLILVASPELIQAAVCHGDLPGFIARHLVLNIGYQRQWAIVRQCLKISDQGTGLGPTVDTNMAAIELAANGGGFALTHRIYLDSYFRSGRLVVALDREFPDDYSFWVCTPERATRSRSETNAFREWLFAAGKRAMQS
jgi:LysR family glycine cleavage system transcriptional activator